MDLDERKKKFAILLQQMLNNFNGIKSKLAEQLEISPQRLAPWLQGKVDPAELGIETFARLAKLKGYTVDELASHLGLLETETENTLIKFRQLILEMLEGISQDELAKNLSISQNTISKWLDREREIDPKNIPTIRMIAIAQSKKWSMERLLMYLGLKIPETENNLLFKLQTGATILPFNEQVKFLGWLSALIEEKVVKGEITQGQTPPFEESLDKNNETELSLHHACIILEKEDLAIGSIYLKNLNIYTQLQLENIDIATIDNIPQKLNDFDLLIFDIQTEDSRAIELIKQLSFDGNIVILASLDLSNEVRSSLETKVTEVIVKPIDWSELKDKSYFT